MTLKEKVEASVAYCPVTGCWLWAGGRGSHGYGQVYYNKTDMLAHRASWNAFRGEIPKGLDLDHKCRQRMCVNPDHLDPVTRKENLRRGLRGVLTTACPHGHPYVEGNLKSRKDGTRDCLTCHRERQKRYSRRAPVT